MNKNIFRKEILLLQETTLFRNIGEDEILGLLTCLGAEKKQYNKGEFIFLAGEKAALVGIVLGGKVQVIKEDFFGNRTILTEVTSRNLFGESFPFAEEEKLPVSVMAVSDCEVLFIDYKKIITTCSTVCVYHSKLIENMLYIIARKNIILNEKIQVMSKRTTREKLLSYLQNQAMKAGGSSFEIPFNRQELADYLCVDRSAMSNELSKLREEGLLNFHKNEFVLLTY